MQKVNSDIFTIQLELVDNDETHCKMVVNDGDFIGEYKDIILQSYIKEDVNVHLEMMKKITTLDLIIPEYEVNTETGSLNKTLLVISLYNSIITNPEDRTHMIKFNGKDVLVKDMLKEHIKLLNENSIKNKGLKLGIHHGPFYSEVVVTNVVDYETKEEEYNDEYTTISFLTQKDKSVGGIHDKTID